MPTPKTLDVSVWVFESGTANSVAISTSKDDTTSETRALEYLIEYISSPTLFITPLLKNKDPANMAKVIIKIVVTLKPSTFAMNPSVFAPRVKAVKNDETIIKNLSHFATLQTFLKFL